VQNPLAVRLVRALNFVGRYAAALGVTVFTLTLGVASSRRRDFIRELARTGGYRGWPRPRLPEVSVADVTRADTPVTLPVAEGADGNVSLLELLVLSRMARERRPRAVFEIGTFNGRTTLALAANAPDATVFTLDLPPDQSPVMPLSGGERAFVDKPAAGALLVGTAESARVRQVFGDSATFDFAPYQVDMVFVDGSHAYHYVLKDSINSLAMLREGRGLIAWHDYGVWEGVTRALNHLRDTDPRFARLKHIRGTTLAVLET
jgi:hypothetical protein